MRKGSHASDASGSSHSGGQYGGGARRGSIQELAQRATQAARGTATPRKHSSPHITLTSLWGRIVSTQLFENTALVLILSNAIWIGVDVNYNVKDTDSQTRDVPKEFFQVGESLFCLAFIVEMTLRILAYEPRVAFFTDHKHSKWNIFDFALVVLMIIETWILAYAFDLEENDDFRFLSSLRLLRLLRISRVFRLVPELGIMVKSLMAAVRSVSSTAVLAVGIMYIFAILMTQWVKGLDEDKTCLEEDEFGNMTRVCVERYFGTIPDSFLTLTQILVFDDTFEIVRPVFEEDFRPGLLLIIYMLIVSFTILNMLIGIICDIVSETEKVEKEKMLRIEVEELFKLIDQEGKGVIARKEFEAATTAMQRLEDMGISKSILQNAFDILDRDGIGMLELGDFIAMIFKCLHPPTSSDVLLINRRIDRLAELLGVGRTATAVLTKEHARLEKKYKQAQSQEGTTLFPMNSRIGGMAGSSVVGGGQDSFSRSLQNADGSTAGGSTNTSVANPIYERMGNLRTMLTACQRALEARDGSYLEAAALATRSEKHTFEGIVAKSRSTGATGTSSGDTTAELGIASASRELFPPMGEADRAAKRAALAPALRLLSSQLFALRAEHKAAGLHLGGEERGTSAQITTVIECLGSTLACLEPHTVAGRQ
mmetsp:Transcript_19092/g.44636  ORF Transcript_19092/g.44636 Transcript_19092/m.44636 type:complete len:655 (+) Transcript_19092:150-2114(+)